MAEEADDPDAVGDNEEGDGEQASSGGGKKKIIIIIGLVFLIIVGGVAGAYFMGLLDPVIEMIVGPEDAAEGEEDGEECEEGQSSNNQLDDYGVVTSECYHVIEITAKQWVWAFDCLDLSTEICDTGSDNIEVYGTVPLLSLKTGETYLANMRSEDVTHAPWFLGMGVKEDTLYGAQIGPSEYNWPTTLWLPISDIVDDQIILCTEYCGDAHSVMAGKLVVHQ